MKKLIPFLFILTILTSGCNRKKSDIEPDFKGQFRIEFSDGQVIDQNKIEFYDFSSSLIYLKTGVSFTPEQQSGTFDVFANNEKVYSGVIHPMYASYLPHGANISTLPSFFGSNVIHIDFLWLSDKPKQDLRADPRITDALKRNNQFRAGLSCEIVTLMKNTPGKIILQMRLTNNETEDLYYLDHDKMGSRLFHYFTNGLSFSNSLGQRFTPNIQSLAPAPQNSWKQEWLSLLKGKESRVIEIQYDQFDDIPAGNYAASFQYPGLAHQVSRSDLYQNNARIWLGTIETSRNVSFQ